MVIFVVIVIVAGAVVGGWFCFRLVVFGCVWESCYVHAAILPPSERVQSGSLRL